MSWFLRPRSLPPDVGPITVGDYLERTIRSPYLRGLMEAAPAQDTPDESSPLSAALTEKLANLRCMLEQHASVDPKAWTRLAEASQEAAKPTPDVTEIRALIDQAARYAADAPGFVAAATELAAHIAPPSAH